jgi:hypothetical protein
MEFSGEGISTPKERGEWAEARFLAKAAQEGFRVSKPWGDSARYDFAVEREGRFLRIQVKSTVSRLRDGYRCLLQPPQAKENPKKLYSAEQVDFFAAYVIPEDAWYIFPAEVAVKMRGRAWLFPGSPGHKYEKYKEAWELLRAAAGGAVEDEGCVEEEGVEMRAEVEGVSVGYDSDVVRGRIAACFARMRK